MSRRIPDDEKRARGTDQPCRMKGDTAQWETLSEIPQCPEHFGSDMRECWMDACGQLLYAGLLCVPYLRIVEGYCTAYATWSAATRGIKEEGLHQVQRYQNGTKKIVVNPLTKVQASAMTTMLSYAAHLGFSPKTVDNIPAKRSEPTGSLLK